MPNSGSPRSLGKPNVHLAIIKKIVETQGGKITSDLQIGADTSFLFTWL
ncbi:hypothetical protein [Nostoc sp. WHI]|nr:hypothetical protein [Nostoc sp. WHI]